MANVQTKKSTQVATINLLEDAGLGLEDMGRDDLMIPRLNILQQMSKQVQKRENTYVKGAEPGMIFDNVAKAVHDGEVGIKVVPISYRRAHIEWRKDMGGLVADHGSDDSCLSSCTRGDKGEYITGDGNEIIPTGEYFVFLITEDGYTPAMISMGKSQLKKAKQWNTMMNRLMIDVSGRKVNPAIFWTSYTLKTIPEQSDAGSWFGWSVECDFDAKSGGIIKNLPNGEEIYLAARDFKAQLKAGNVQVSPDAPDDDVM